MRQLFQHRLRPAVYLLLFALFFPAIGTAKVTVSTTLTPSSFSVDQYGQLNITVNGARSADFELPEVEGLNIIQRGQSSSFQMVNGKTSVILTTTCIIQAYAAGNYTIPSFKVVTKDAELMTEPISLKVTGAGSGQKPSGVAGSPAPSSAEEIANSASMTIENLEGKHYVGEIIPITIRAWLPQQLRISQISYPRLSGEGFVIPEIKEDPVQMRQMVENRAFTVLVWETELTPIKEGEHTLTLEMDAVQLIPQRRMSTSVFGNRSPLGDDLFDDFFGTTRKKQITISSDPQPVTVTPLPSEGKPANFTGTVGTFTLTTEVSPQQAEVGEPLTLKITIEGTGNIDGVEPPLFPESDNWKAYTPSLLSTDKNGKSGKRVYEQAIVAKNDRVDAVPPLTFSYFDPEKEQYIKANSSSLPISIKAVQLVAVPPPITSTPVEEDKTALLPDRTGPAPIKYKLGTPVASIKPLFQRTIFLVPAATLLLFFLAVSGLHLLRIRKKNRPVDPAGKLRRELLIGIEQLKKDMEGAYGQKTVAGLRLLIQQQLGGIWNCAPEAITLADLERKLQMTLPDLVSIYRRTEEAAYGGGIPDQKTMADFLKTVEEEMEKLL